MTRNDKVQAYFALGLNQRRQDYAIGSSRWIEAGNKMIETMNKMSPAAKSFFNRNFFDKETDWSYELSVL